ALLEASRAAVSDLPDVVVGVAPHSLRAATPEELAEILPLAQGGPIHIHIAEQTREVVDSLAWSGARPVDWLLDHAPVDQRWCLVHATHATNAETDRLAASGAVAGLCPITEANLGDGLFPAKRFLAAGGRFGVGTDSNVLIDFAEELRLLEYGQRLTERKRNRLGVPERPSVGASLFVSAVQGGAQALGVAGGIAPGASADILCLDADHPSLVGRAGDALLDGFVFAAGAAAIERVWRAGVGVVRDGRHSRRPTVSSRYRRSLERLLA
ncbi:MAG: amidohydrolase family protein, partial [Caulobacteraceae bacterium]